MVLFFLIALARLLGYRPTATRFLFTTLAQLEKTMSVDPDTRKRVEQWLMAKCPHMKCTGCGRSDFNVGDLTMPFSIPNYDGLSVPKVFMGEKAGNYYGPTIAVECAHCGCIISFAAGKIGVVPD